MRGLICDDHPLVREALAASLRECWPDLTLQEAGDYPAAWTLADAGADLVLVDLGMPGAGPVDGVKGLRARLPDARILVLTGLTDRTLLDAVEDCGVSAIVSKNADTGVLLDAIRAAAPELQALEAGRLPPRQREVLGLLAEGLTNKEIALRLGISPATVKIHVARLSTWLGAVNRTDAVARAQRARLI
jgi:DNA-binding NarL/FixJ family response regulator